MRREKRRELRHTLGQQSRSVSASRRRVLQGDDTLGAERRLTEVGRCIGRVGRSSRRVVPIILLQDKPRRGPSAGSLDILSPAPFAWRALVSRSHPLCSR